MYLNYVSFDTISVKLQLGMLNIYSLTWFLKYLLFTHKEARDNFHLGNTASLKQ